MYKNIIHFIMLTAKFSLKAEYNDVMFVFLFYF